MSFRGTLFAELLTPEQDRLAREVDGKSLLVGGINQVDLERIAALEPWPYRPRRPFCELVVPDCPLPKWHLIPA